MKPTVAYIGFGSNLAHPRRQLARATAALARLPRSRARRRLAELRHGADRRQRRAAGLRQRRRGAGHDARAARAAAAAAGASSAASIAGAAKPTRNASRTLDLDLLLYGARRIGLAHLVVPHPRMHERAFVLRPLRDIAPAVRHPGPRSCATIPARRARPAHRTHPHPLHPLAICRNSRSAAAGPPQGGAPWGKDAEGVVGGSLPARRSFFRGSFQATARGRPKPPLKFRIGLPR